MKITGQEFVGNLNSIFNSWMPARQIVEESFDHRHDIHPSGLIMELNQFCPWQLHLYDIEDERSIPATEKILYVIFQDSGPDASWYKKKKKDTLAKK